MAKEYLPFRANKRIPSLGWYLAGGGVVCSECFVVKQTQGEKLIPVSLQEISAIQILQKEEWKCIQELVWSREEAEVVHECIYQFICYHSEKKIPDWYHILQQVTT